MSAPPTPVSIESLLEHRAWVHRVARALVSDASSADDLEQEAWVRAQTKPPSHGGALTAWLGTVLRRAASDMRRSEQRRKKREEAAARPECQRSTADLVAEAEVLKRVVEALLELEEPYRTALLLRYFDGLTPPQIAARTGVPLETARTRLKRGLERLRGRFDRESGGRRATWTLALLPLSKRASPGPQVPFGGVSVVGTTLGALLVTLKAKAALAVAALLVAALGAAALSQWGDEAPRVAAPTPAPPEMATAPGLQPAPVRVAAMAGGGETSKDAAEAGGGVPPPALNAGACGILVEVLDERGMRVRTGTVRLSAGGAPSVDSLVKSAELTLKMAADPERYGWLMDPLDLARGNPAEVKEIPGEFAGLELEARADVPPYAPVVSVLPSPLEAGGVVRVRLTMQPGRRVEFIVTDAADGRPVANARILSTTELSRRGEHAEEAATADGPGWATTGADGRATVSELGGGVHDVEILAEGYRPGRIDDGSLEGGLIAVRLDVSRDDSVLDAVVRDPSGAPVVGQRVYLNTRLRLTPVVLATDASGVARFERLAPGIQTLRLESSSWVRRALDAHWPKDPRCTTFGYVEDLAAGATRRISLGYLPPGGVMMCEVVDVKGAPLPGVGVRLMGAQLVNGTTDALGRVEFRDLAPGTYRTILLPHGSNRWIGPEREFRGGTFDQRLVLGSRSISGVVRGAGEGHAPLAGASIYAESELGSGATSGPDGSFVIRGAAPGRYRIEAILDGFATGWVAVDVASDADAVAPDILLFHGGRILLRAAPADREALAEARLRLTDAEAKEVALGQDVSGGEDFRRTHLLPPGRYVLEIVRVGRAASERVIDVEEGRDTVVVLAGP